VDNDIFRLIKRFEKDNHLILKDGYLARQMVKKPKIRALRDKDELIIARDRAKKLTIFFKKPKL